MPREKAQAVTAARPKVPMRRLGAHCLVVAMKAGQCRVERRGWVTNAGSGQLRSGDRPQEEPDEQWKAAAFARWHEPDEFERFTSGICVRLGVNSPGPTRHLQTYAVQRNPTSLDNLVGAGKQHRCHCKSERFGGLQVDDQLELGRRLHWKTSHCDIDTDDGSAATSNRYTSALSGTCAGVPPDRVGSADGVRSRGQSAPNAARLCC